MGNALGGVTMADFWRIIRYIRLDEVVWPGGMYSVPDALEDAVLTAVERVAIRNGIELDGTEESVTSIEFAIEEALTPVGECLPLAENVHLFAMKARKEGRFYAAISGFLFSAADYEQDDEAALEALLVYQLDQLIGAYKYKEYEKALHISADIFEIQRLLGARAKHQEISASATARANIRHQEMKSKKSELLQEWDASGGEYESRADFARIISKLRGVKYRTLYEWIAGHEKQAHEKYE
jgi:hypothetical protein